jgi:hypothetical protein
LLSERRWQYRWAVLGDVGGRRAGGRTRRKEHRRRWGQWERQRKLELEVALGLGQVQKVQEEQEQEQEQQQQ